jgi:menaquinol-cytochrome c reductase iron-sulfur subunit
MTSPNPHSSASASKTPDGARRRFFQVVINAAAGFIGLGLAVPLVGYLVSPALKRRKQQWVDVASAREIPTGVPKQLEYVATIQDGYLESKTQKAVWAVKQSNGDVTVFSPMCTHLGCGYHWDGGSQQFKCPCHGSVYDISGRVVAGPAPRPLDALPSKVDNGRLLIVFKEFKSGVSKQIEL